jgi:ubiquinone/menaquinone biosynthesis C-methylase UbiE
MTQNIYDNEEFFARYSRLPRSVEGLDGAPEWPVVRALLPDLAGRRVLDLGCGFGWFCRWARERGAARVEGVDVSELMLRRARATTSDPTILYVRADLEHLKLPAAGFHLVYSSLVLHYIKDLERLLTEVGRTLIPGGRLVFSVEHPIFTAPNVQSWLIDGAGRKAWPLNGYLDEGPRCTDWLAAGVVKQHRTLATYINLLLRSGFALTRVEEWGPSIQQIAARPQLADEHERPPFLLLAAQR